MSTKKRHCIISVQKCDEDRPSHKAVPTDVIRSPTDNLLSHVHCITVYTLATQFLPMN